MHRCPSATSHRGCDQRVTFAIHRFHSRATAEGLGDNPAVTSMSVSSPYPPVTLAISAARLLTPTLSKMAEM
jgi:hypothetical protein